MFSTLIRTKLLLNRSCGGKRLACSFNLFQLCSKSQHLRVIREGLASLGQDAASMHAAS